MEKVYSENFCGEYCVSALKSLLTKTIKESLEEIAHIKYLMGEKNYRFYLGEDIHLAYRKNLVSLYRLKKERENLEKETVYA